MTSPHPYTARSFRFLLLVFAGLLCFGTIVSAAPDSSDDDTSDTLTDKTSKGPTRAAFVDIEVVLDSSKAVRTIVSAVDTELGDQAKTIDAKKRDQRKAQLALEQQDSVLSETERAARQEKISTMLNEIDEMEYKFQREVKERQRTTVEPLLEQVIKTVGEVGRREGYDLVVRGEMVLYGRETADLTPLVIRELDTHIDQLRVAVEKSTGKKISPAASVTPTATARPLSLIP